MKTFKGLIVAAAVVVFVICTYSFLLGNKVFQGEFGNDPISWYIMAKGIFCSLSLILLYKIIEAVSSNK